MRNSRFIIFNARLSATNFGYTLYMITVPAYAFVLTNSILFTGLSLFVEYGIYAMTFWAGPITDRVRDKRYLISISEAGIAVASLLLAWLMHSGNVDRYVFLLLLGVIAMFWDVIWTADHSVLPLIVRDEELARANGITNAIGSGHVAAGLAVGGFLFAFVGAYGSMILYAGSMLIATVLTLMLPVVIPEEDRNLKPDFLSGWSYIFRNNRNLLKLAIVIGIFSVFANVPILAMAGIFAENFPLLYSASFSLFYIGAMISGLVVGRHFPYRHMGRTLIATYILSGITMVIAALNSLAPAVDVIFWFLLGFFFSVHTTLNTVYLQKVTVKEMLGRTASNLYTFRGATTAFGSIVLPLLMEWHGIIWITEVSGIVMTVGAALIFAISPSIARLGFDNGITEN